MKAAITYEDQFIKDLASACLKRATRITHPLKLRKFMAAINDRLTGDWLTTVSSIDSDIKSAISNLRARSRDLEQNNDYVKRYLSLLEDNVIGDHGITLQNKALSPDGQLDKKVNDLVEDSWRRWGEYGVPTVDGRMSWHDIEKMVIRTVARDGECLIREIKNFPGNPWRYALQVLDADHLDTEYDNRILGNGNTVRMGIEYDEWKKPVAYYLLTVHPGDTAFVAITSRRHVRIPAEEIIHIYQPMRPEQTRGVPWLHTAMYRLHMIGAYDKAHVIAARLGASKMAAYTVDADKAGEWYGDGEDYDGAFFENIEPGAIPKLPSGVDIKQLDWNYPDSEYGPFMKAALRGTASGLDVSYNALANDLEGVNFSSIRQGVLEDRNHYRMLQRFISSRLHNRVFNGWLPMALMTDLAGLVDFMDIDRIRRPHWQGRGWPWVDPKKDAESAILQINNKLNTRTNILAERGLHFPDVITQLQAEKKLIEEAGLDTGTVDQAVAGADGGNNDA